MLIFVLRTIPTLTLPPPVPFPLPLPLVFDRSECWVCRLARNLILLLIRHDRSDSVQSACHFPQQEGTTSTVLQLTQISDPGCKLSGKIGPNFVQRDGDS